MKKNTKKRIVKIVIMAVVIIGILLIRNYNLGKREKPEIYKDGLSFESYKLYLFRYGFISEDEYKWDTLDKIEQKGIVVTENTKLIVNRFNNIFFNKFSEKYDIYKSEIEELTPIFEKKYSISKDKQLSTQWVFDNPKKSLELVLVCSKELNFEIFNYEN